MLSKFMLVSETRFQNIETTLKNQQALIQGLETQIGQLSKLISKQPQGSLPSNTEPNPREQLNAIYIQDDGGVVELEPELRQETVVSKGQGEEMSLKGVHEPFSNNSHGPIHEERRLKIEELDEWRTHKPRTHDFQINLRFSTETRVSIRACLGPCDNREKISVKTGYDKMPRPCSMAVVEPAKTTRALTRAWVYIHGHERSEQQQTRSCAPTPKEHKRVLNADAPKFEIRESYELKLGNTGVLPGRVSCHLYEEKKSPFPLPRNGRERNLPWVQPRKFIILSCSSLALLTIDPWELFFGIIEPPYLKLMMELCSTFHLQTVITNYNDPGTVQFCLGGLICQFSIPEFGRRESTGIINTHDTYFSWCMSHRHVIDLAYFITLAIQHQTERHRKGVISICPYVTRLARHFGLLDTVTQESSLTLIGQMSPQGISSMLSMTMIEKHQGTYPPQYHLAQSTEVEAYEDIPNDVPPQYEDPPTQPRPPSRPAPVTASYANISERLTRFKQ
ncbi:hypothetical protein GOBAR_AA07042 [Gossypium barbadense]|uniref:Uncharacterized protein n=1 Tax=Gossypium barbadense TaxID=3634 RepID=A0A2P5YD67_GOSBA|nr:hypothetical protein GOBAR_AA07042 [Gossypium barbadense]